MRTRKTSPTQRAAPRLVRLGLLVAALITVVPAAAGPTYVQSPPLSEVLVRTQVQPVQASTHMRLPIITWGGDIATILANGNAARTASGSLFADAGFKLELVREDVFVRQVEAYMAGRSPYLRGTLGMLNLAAEALSRDPRTKPVVIYQMTWSAGGDAVVVSSGIHSAKDLKGKRIALQAYGPHVDYLTKILVDAGLSAKDVQIKWLPDLTGTDDTPMAALQAGEVDAAFVITPDALVLTSGGAVGSGAEGSVKGARILLSTRTANRIIADVYAVRSDYLAEHRDRVQALVHGLLRGEDALRQLVQDKARQAGKYRQTMTAAARLLLDSPQAVPDAEGLYADAEFVGWQGNNDFFANPAFPRSLQRLTGEIQSSFLGLGLLAGTNPLADASWDYGALRAGLGGADRGSARRFKEDQVAAVVARRQQQGTLADGELFSFEIYFQPNQNDFAVDLYQASFDKVLDLAATYGGALITVEGHSDPLGYLKKRKSGQPEVVLGRIKQSAKNLSLSRAIAVRDSVIGYGRSQGLALDESQFAVLGHGIAQPRSGVCGAVPCAPKTEKEWRDNMRVEFRILQVEAESSIFEPL